MADPAPAFNALSPEEQQALLDGPAIPPPEGIIPNFDNPPNWNSLAHGAFATCIAATSIFLVLAIYVKVTHFKKVRVEDVCALFSLVGWVCMLVYLYEIVAQYGFFVHMWDIRLRDTPGFFYLLYVATIWYFVVISTIKAAILLEWTRLFVPLGSRNAFYWVCHATAWLNFAASVIMMFLVAFACNPREKYWNPLVLGKCLDANTTAFAAPIVNLVFDIIALILPQRVIWGLHLPWRKKIGVSVLFALGILEMDRTFSNGPVALWCLAEATSGMIIYCVPMAPKALSRFKGWVQTTTGHTSATASKNSSGAGSWHNSIVKSPKPGRYKEIDEVPLTTLPLTRTTASGATGDLENEHSHDSNGIMRTTTTVVNYRSGAGDESPQWDSKPSRAV
ncbi:hypothetical protein AAE478_004426 [Parahypoxylon ruwenzoriense]